MVAYKLEDALRCSLCGTAEWEWEENRFAYEPVATRCHACYLKDIAGEDTHNQPGVTISLLPSEAVTDEMREAAVRFAEEAAEEERNRRGWE